MNANQEAMVLHLFGIASEAEMEREGPSLERNRLTSARVETQKDKDRVAQNARWVGQGYVQPGYNAEPRAVEERLAEFDRRLSVFDKAIAEIDARLQRDAARFAALDTLARRLRQRLIERGVEVDPLGLFLVDQSGALRSGQPVPTNAPSARGGAGWPAGMM